MKRSKRSSLILILLGVGLILAGFIMNYTQEQKEEQQKIEQKEQLIVKNYEQFKQQVEIFSTTRQQIYDLIFNGTVLTEFPQKQNTWYQSLEEYEKKIDSITELGDKTIPLCDTTYPNKDVNSKCASLEKAYETARNSFVKDISKYNQLVVTYNEQKQEEAPIANIYMSKYKEYIDLNQDHVYEGKE